MDEPLYETSPESMCLRDSVETLYSLVYREAPGQDESCAAGNVSAAAMVSPVSGQPGQNSLDGICLSARSAASHEACSEGDEAGCTAGEICMHPVLAKDEHLYKVCTYTLAPSCPFIGRRKMPMHGMRPLGQCQHHCMLQ